jgi:hypothetical protein
MSQSEALLLKGVFLSSAINCLIPDHRDAEHESLFTKQDPIPSLREK